MAVGRRIDWAPKESPIADRKTLQELLTQAGVTINLRLGGILPEADTTPFSPARTVPTTAPHSAPSRPSLGRYAITGDLGAGGMGQVLKVLDGDLDRQVAAKIMLDQQSPEALARFVREAQFTGQLQHPGIVPVHELSLAPDGKVYFTMKAVQGRDLSEILDEDQGMLEPSGLVEHLTRFLKICDAMAFAHSQGVLHRDLKPDNIMVGAFGEVLVMDWGLARQLRIADRESRIVSPSRFAASPSQTLQGTITGTPSYMPPEQAAGQTDQLSERSDIYSLGAILYEMLTLEPPYTGDSAHQILDRVIQAELIAPTERAPSRQIPWELEAVALKAMAPRQDDRYQTVEALGDDIQAYLNGRELAAARYSTLQLLRKWVRRHRALCSGVAAVLIAALGMLGWMRWQRHARIQEHLALGQKAAEARQVEHAAREFGQVLAIAPRHAAAQTGLIELYLSSVDRLLAGKPTAEQLAALWKARDAAILKGQPERPEEQDAQQDREATMNAYLAGVATLDRAIARLPDSKKLRSRRLQAGRALGWVALLGRDYSLSRQAFTQLQYTGLTSTQAQKLARHVDQDRTRRLGLWKVRLQKILDDLRQGLSRDGRGKSSAQYEDHLIEATGYRHPEIATLLGKELQRFADRRARHTGSDKLVWLPPERQLAIFLCQVLGRLPLRESMTALSAWMRVVSDDRLAAEAGIALCNTRLPQAHGVLTAAMRRLGVNSKAWEQIKPFFGRVPDPIGKGSGIRTAAELNESGLDGAITDLTMAIKLDPRNVRALVIRGNLRQDRGDLHGAIADYDRALKINVREVKAWVNRGVAQTRLGRRTEALVSLRQALKLAPDKIKPRIRSMIQKLGGN